MAVIFIVLPEKFIIILKLLYCINFFKIAINVTNGFLYLVCLYVGTLDVILKMIRYKGFYGFYKGMSTKIVQSVLAATVLFMIKEELVRGTRSLLTNGSIKIARSKPP